MYLKTLELFGFKSFLEKTVLRFDPGITVVVGPNGCGKSNIFDAIRWALGEQSPKSLRGSRMEDVIFGGTATHPPLNYCEVTLVFSNEDNYLPIEYKEVAVTRRLYRSGESQYFINKNPCRLKDIQDLFMGTGVGEASYSFIEQGKVEALISYKPEEKRLIFDEASGIVKYKERKKETLRKLKDTDENILRLDDVISEVKRQIRYLERQVEKAKKYRELNDQLIAVEKKISSYKFGDIERKINALLDELRALKDTELVKVQELNTNRNSLSQKENELNRIRGDLEETKSEILKLRSRIENHRNHININYQRIEELKERSHNIDVAISDSRVRADSQKKRIEEAKLSLEQLESSFSSLKEEGERLKKRKDDAHLVVEQLSQEINRLKGEILHLEEEKVHINNADIELSAHLKNLSSRKKRLLLDKGRVETMISEHQDKLAGVSSRMEELRGRFSELKGRRGSLQTQLQEIKNVTTAMEREVIEGEKTLVELNSYLEFLRGLKIKYADFPVSQRVRIIFEERPSQINKLIASLKDVNFQSTEDGSKYYVDVEAKIISLPEEELVSRIDKLTREIDEKKNVIQRNEERSREIEESLSRQSGELDSVEQELRRYIQERSSIEEDLQRFEDEKVLLDKELEEVLDDLREKEKEKNTYDEKRKSIDEVLAETKKKLDDNQKTIDENSRLINQLSIEITRKETELTSFYERKDSLVSKLAILEEEYKNTLAGIEGMEREKLDISLRMRGLEEEITNLEESIHSEEESIRLYEDKQRQQESSLRIQEEEIAQLSSLIIEQEKEVERVKGEVYERNLKIQQLNFEKTKIVDYMKQVYSIDFTYEGGEEPAESKDVLEEEKERLKKRIDSLGEVNLVAIDEFKELNERYDFLNSQREDLLASKESLKKAIQKINRTSKDMFLEVFRKVEEEFKKYFRFLFGGGRAQLVLLDEENVLESGVDIEVQPPGKKLQNVSLLSGGEKALTAIALIFAIFKVRPSPLCVLDEIDAPLDEANVDRFNHLLEEFAPTSQFIIITHNKKTMSKADVLYGVTMQEKGVSKLVSVKFAEEAKHASPSASANQITLSQGN